MNWETASQLRIRTPEGVEFAHSLASPAARLVAWAMDFFCILAAVRLLASALSFSALISADLANSLQILGYFLVSIGYGIASEWLWRGQTVGKRLLRLRVIDAEGLRLTFNQVVIRNLLRFVDCLPFAYALGGMVCVASRHWQRLGDIAANTVVVRAPRITSPNLDQIMPGKFNSLRRHPHLAARLRQRVTPAEAALVLQALLRREELLPENRVALFAALARHFAAKAAFPPEATDGIADEQYLRNVADILFRSTSRATESAAANAAASPAVS